MAIVGESVIPAARTPYLSPNQYKRLNRVDSMELTVAMNKDLASLSDGLVDEINGTAMA
jgi:hypothetical protein